MIRHEHSQSKFEDSQLIKKHMRKIYVLIALILVAGFIQNL